MEVYKDRSVKEFWVILSESELAIRGLLSSAPYSMKERVRQWCDTWERIGVIHSNCNTILHYDIEWKARVSAEEKLGGALIFLYQFNSKTVRLHSYEKLCRPYNSASKDGEKTFDSQLRFLASCFSEDSVYLLIQDLTRAASELEIDVKTMLCDLVKSQWGVEVASFFKRLCDSEQVLNKLSCDKTLVDGLIFRMRSELTNIANDLKETKSFSKSKTIMKLRKRLEKSAQELTEFQTKFVN